MLDLLLADVTAGPLAEVCILECPLVTNAFARDLLVALIEIVEMIFREETTKTNTIKPTNTILKRSLDFLEVFSH